jgi:hypothetical protein
VENDCLVRIADHKLIRYLGDSSTFCIGADISVVSDRCFSGSDKLEKVVFDSNACLKLLAAGAFSYCRHLRSITVPKSVIVIGAHCFYECRELMTVSFEFPASIRRIDSEAFSDCSSLTSFTGPSSVSTLGESVFFNCAELSFVTFESPSNLTDSPDELFMHCKLLTGLCLPDSVVTIGDRAFAHTSLDSLNGRGVSKTDCFIVHLGTIVHCFRKPESVVILSTVREIGESVFDCVSSLVDLSFEEGVERIRFSAFSHCFGLTVVAFPASLVAIDEGAFEGCIGLREVTFAADSKLRYIGKDAFEECPLERVCLPASVTEIGPSAFTPEVWKIVQFEKQSHLLLSGNFLCSADSRTLLRVLDSADVFEVPAQFEVIGKNAFLGCSLDTFIFANGSRLREIGEEAFYDSELRAISLPSSVEILGDRCFENCRNLRKVTFEEPSKLKKIVSRAFACSRIQSFRIPALTNEIAGSAFVDCPL